MHNRLKITKSDLQLTHENTRNLTNLTLPGASISLNRFSEFEFFVIFSLIFNFFRMSTYYLGALKHMENSCDYVFGHENKNKKILQSSWHKAQGNRCIRDRQSEIRKISHIFMCDLRFTFRNFQPIMFIFPNFYMIFTSDVQIFTKICILSFT